MLGCCATYDTLEKVNGFLLLWKITKLNYFADKIASDLMTQTHLLYFHTLPLHRSLPLDARNYLLSTWICKIMQFIMSGSIFSYLFLPEERRKTIWSELELNPGPLASRATARTTRPCLLGQKPNSLVVCSAGVLSRVPGVNRSDVQHDVAEVANGLDPGRVWQRLAVELPLHEEVLVVDRNKSCLKVD